MRDLLVIGAGWSGLSAALTAANHGLTVRVIAKGLGSMHWTAGSFDLLGYPPGHGTDAADTPVTDPLAAIADLPAAHPLARVGRHDVRAAIDAMRSLWLEDYSTYRGEHFSFDKACSFPKPARAGGVPILIGGESKAAMRRIAKRGDGWLPYNLPIDEAASAIGELREMTRAEGRDPDSLRIIKIVYSNAHPDDLKRFRDAGVTEFNIASSGEIPTDEAGIRSKFAEFGETIVEPISRL